MPIFEYRCEKCKKTFETLVFGNQEVSCPKCKGKNVKKLMSAFSHSSDGKFASSAGPGCGSCSATSCGPS
jgi:putative FmdB family regulatory protein